MDELEPDAYLATWGTPAERGAVHGLNRYLLELWESRPDLADAFPDLDGDDGRRFVRWIYTSGRHEHPIPDGLLPPCPEDLVDTALAPERHAHDIVAAEGVNVVGFLHGELGLGEAARLVVEGLDAADVPVLPVDAAMRYPTRGGVAYATVAPDVASFPATVACANPDLLGELRRSRDPRIRALVPTRATVAYTWWEVEDAVPQAWRMEDLSWLNEIWVGSEHVRRCVQPFVPVPVATVGLPVDPPPPPPAGSPPAVWLPPGFRFLTAFDYASDIRRKNPLAAVHAFSAAFPPGSGVSLIIKVTGAAEHPVDHTYVSQATTAHPDIHVIDRMLDAAEYNGLIAACDAYVSLHRAEGFGIPLAVAMHHGRPVVATAHSGNLDYMTDANSYLVPATPRGVGSSAVYPADGTWAEPDVVAAIDIMRAITADPGAAAARGAQGAADIRRTHAPAVVGRRMRERLEAITVRRPARPVGEHARALLAARAAAGAAGAEDDALAHALLGAIAQVDARAGADLDAALRAGARGHAATLRAVRQAAVR